MGYVRSSAKSQYLHQVYDVIISIIPHLRFLRQLKLPSLDLCLLKYKRKWKSKHN